MIASAIYATPQPDDRADPGSSGSAAVRLAKAANDGRDSVNVTAKAFLGGLRRRLTLRFRAHRFDIGDRLLEDMTEHADRNVA